MSAADESRERPSSSAGDCPLPPALQTRNLSIYAACMGLLYLAAPVTYVGVTQGALCNSLGASATLANIPTSAYFATSAGPVLFAWFVPYVSWLRRNLVICFLTVAATQALVAVALVTSVSDELKIGAVILQSALAGIFGTSAIGFLWEMLGRGVSENRRGLTLSLAFGVGPILAALGSLGQQALLNDDIRGRWFPGLDFPWNFATLYALACPMMALAALLVSFCAVPLPDQELRREPFFEGVFGGIWSFLTNRVLLTATVVTVLIYAGNNIASNMNLYSEEVLGAAPAEYAGLQLFFRFSFKAVAGLLMGWLLTKSHPKAGILTTGGLYILSQVWAILAVGNSYLIAFGIYGAGELIGVYAPNYILSASRPDCIRRNLAFVMMLGVPTAPFATMFGAITDHLAGEYGLATGFRVSFATCAAIMLAGMMIAVVCLPRRPNPVASLEVV